MSVVTTKGVVYARVDGYRPLCLDLHIPSGEQRGLCLYLHGGGWRRGSRGDAPGETATWPEGFFTYVAAAGLAVASLDYRLSSEACYPAQLTDVQAADEFLTTHREDLGLTSARRVGWGVSAGGHLIAMHALTTGLDAAALWYAPTDLARLPDDVAGIGGVADRSATSREGQLLGGALDSRQAAVRAASPVHAIPTDAPPRTPFLLLHGTADLAVPPTQSVRFAQAVVEAGGTAVVESVEGAGHMFTGLDSARTRSAVERTVAFLLGPGDPAMPE